MLSPTLFNIFLDRIMTDALDITNGISIDIRVNGEKLDEVDSESIWAQSS